MPQGRGSFFVAVIATTGTTGGKGNGRGVWGERALVRFKRA